MLEPPTHPAAEDELLETCPYCGYALTGLPVYRVCPECGREVDRRWTVYGHVGTRKTQWLMIGMGVFCLVMFVVAWLISSRWHAGVYVGASVLIAAVHYWRARRRDRAAGYGFFAVGTKMLVAYYPRNNWRQVPLDDVLEARADWIFGDLKVKVFGDTLSFGLKEVFGNCKSEVKRCAKQINSLVESEARIAARDREHARVPTEHERENGEERATAGQENGV